MARSRLFSHAEFPQEILFIPVVVPCLRPQSHDRKGLCFIPVAWPGQTVAPVMASGAGIASAGESRCECLTCLFTITGMKA